MFMPDGVIVRALRRTITVSVAAAVALGCGGRYGDGPQRPGGPATSSGKVPKGGIAAAALEYQILDARTGRQVDTAAFWAKLAATSAVCVGEEHPNPHHHWVQLEVMSHVAKSPPVALGMEMFQRPFQGVLDDYAAKRIDAAALRSRSGWEERWGYDYGFYGPIIDVAVAARGQLLALNASRELTKKVVRKGLDSLTPAEKTQVPELNLDDKTHRAWFDTLMDSMGGHGGMKHTAPAPASTTDKPAEPPKDEAHAAPPMPSADQIYTVQVIWDETMADTSAKWLKANPTGHLVIIAGNGHCHDTAIVNRIKRRGITNVISVRPVIDDGEGQVAELLASPVNDYLVVLQMPPGVTKMKPPAE